MRFYLFVLLCVEFYLVNSYIIDPGPVTKATQGTNKNKFDMIKLLLLLSIKSDFQGEIWPKPFKKESNDYFSIVQPRSLKFKVNICILDMV